MERRIMYNDSLFNAFARSFEARSQTDMSMAEYLESCRSDPMRYANATERLLAAIGEPQMIDTAKDPRLGRIFLNRTMRLYPAFAGFYGMEETIERIVGFFRHAAQGLEERKQILYLLGPVGGGKSSLAERLKSLMEVHPIYVLKAGDELSPVFERDRKSTRLNSSHLVISYAVFCLKKKKKRPIIKNTNEKMPGRTKEAKQCPEERSAFQCGR